MISGAQLYTLRNFCKTKEELAETLKRVADIGYTSVQLSGVCAYEPEWMAKQLKQNGLVCAVTHYNAELIRTAWTAEARPANAKNGQRFWVSKGLNSKQTGGFSRSFESAGLLDLVLPDLVLQGLKVALDMNN